MQSLLLCRSQYSLCFCKKSKPNKKNLKMECMIFHKFFFENHMTLNPEKCHYMVISSMDPPQKIMLNNKDITGSNERKLLDFLLDSNLDIESQIRSLWRKAGQI